MRNKVIKSIQENRIITIVRGIEADRLIPLAEAMYGDTSS